MSRLAAALVAFVLFFIAAGGCAKTPRAGQDGVIVFVPGVSGDGPWYDDLKRGLHDGGVVLPVESFAWGAPAPLFMLNFNTVSIHDAAEKQLARRLTDIHAAHPSAPILILTHSAGGGVALGAMNRIDENVVIDRLVLLHPSVSPGYDLSGALSRVQKGVTVFHSDRDTTFLEWRTSTFGTYDNIKTAAAGNRGFDASKLDAAAAAKLLQVKYADTFKSLGNDGGHFGPTARRFAQQQIAPLLIP